MSDRLMGGVGVRRTEWGALSVVGRVRLTLPPASGWHAVDRACLFHFPLVALAIGYVHRQRQLEWMDATRHQHLLPSHRCLSFLLCLLAF